MRCALLLLAVLLAVPAQTVRYELRGRLKPGTRASVWLHGAITPFDDSTLADDEGSFRFRDLPPGTYTLGAFVPGRGELRRTIEVGPSLADAKGRIELVVDLESAQFESRESLRRGTLVSARELAIPERANREYSEAAKRLGKRDVPGAVAHLKRAVEIAPQFSAAWNYLGTIAYQTQNYPGAENYFRRALEADPKAYEPLVNLGGVLVNLQKFDEALQYNRHAVLTRPSDALANAQLGMTYFYLGNAELSRKYLTAATQIDPGHFSHPQLMLAEIYVRRGDRSAAANQLEEFLKYHPDFPETPKLKDNIARLRQPAARAMQTAAPAASPAEAYSSTGMARSFSESATLPPLDDFYDAASGRHYRIQRKTDGDYLESRDAGGKVLEARVDGIVGSGRHARVPLSRAANGQWTEMPLAWYTEGGGHWGVGPDFIGTAQPDLGRAVSSDCLLCHTGQTGGHPAGIGCESCHGAGKPTWKICLKCHIESGVHGGHGPSPGGEDRFELNSAAYRLFQSKCYKAAGDTLTCTTCHPQHGFSKTLAEYRQVCRGCHPAMHNSAPLNCTRCHMPKRLAGDAKLMVTDHHIQRPL